MLSQFRLSVARVDQSPRAVLSPENRAKLCKLCKASGELHTEDIAIERDAMFHSPWAYDTQNDRL